MTAVQRIINRVTVECPGATGNAISEALWDAANQFCRRSDANRYVVEVPLMLSEGHYSIVFTDQTVVRVFDVSHDTLDVSGAYYDPDSSELVLINVPGAADVGTPMYLNMSFAPKQSSTNAVAWMPELNWDRYYETVLDGTLMVMYAQVAKPWTSSAKAQYHGKRFRNGINTMKRNAAVGHAPNARGWRYRPWGV